MPRFLAIDWDGVEVRFVLGSRNQEKISVLRIGSVALTKISAPSLAVPETSGKSDDDHENESGSVSRDVPEKTGTRETVDIGADLLALLKSHGVASARNLYALSNTQLDVMYLTLPPAKNEEIPELLKNQAIREFPQFDESQPLDFLALGDLPSEPRRIVAVSLTKAQHNAVRRIARTARRKPAKLQYRSAAVASLALNGRLLPEDAPPTLLVNLLHDELDLVTISDGQILDVRSVKLPELPETEFHLRVLTEISRTIAIGLQDYSDESIGHVLLFLGEQERTELVEALRGRSWEVSVVDPLSLVRVHQKELPKSPGRFTALLGMISSEVPGKKPAIDLLHPKSKPKPPNYAAMALLVFVLLALGLRGLYSWNETALAEERAKLEDLKKTYETQNTLYYQWVGPYTVLSAAATYDRQDAVWLDVIRDITPHFPEQQDMIVNQMSFVSGPIPQLRNGQYYSGRIDVGAMVRDPNVLLKLKQSLEAKRLYHVHIFTPTRNPAGGGYPWNSNFSIRCLRAAPTHYLSFQPDEIRAESQSVPDRYPQPQQAPQPVAR